MKINLNDYVKVNLTDEGASYYHAQYGCYPTLEDNGTLKIQLWELAYIFGKLLYNGNSNLPFESMEIEIERAVK